jgi:outer membrane protein W
MKQLLFLFTMAITIMSPQAIMFAQDSYGPVAGDKTLSLRFGRAASFDISYYEIDHAAQSFYNHSGSSDAYLVNSSMMQPYAATRNTNYHNMNNAIGIEMKYFLTNRVALRFSGSGVISGAPAQNAVEGIALTSESAYYQGEISIYHGGDDMLPELVIPGFQHQPGFSENKFLFDLGADYYFESKFERIFPFVGVQFNSTYASTRIFDGYRGTNDDGEVIPSFPDRKGESYGLGGSIVGGLDYYLASGFFIGLEIKVASFMYNTKKVFPTEGVSPQTGATYNSLFLNDPVLKVGFKF